MFRKKKQDPDRGMELVSKWLRVVLLTCHHGMCKSGAVCITKAREMIHTSKLLENPGILQISGMNYNYEDKCFRDFQSNSYLKRVQKLGKINRHPRNSPDRNSETCIKTFCFMGTRKGGWFPPGPAEGSRKVASSQSANI